MEEVFFEERHHVSRPYSSNYPPQQQLNEAGGRNLLSYLPFRGITQLKEKWSWYRQPQRLKRLASLFISANGDYVAVASKNQITILQKDNDYEEPIGSFTCGNECTFTCGTWCKSRALLGVVDDTDTVYIIKPNGEEITRITKNHLNISSSIIGLIMLHDEQKVNICLCIFTVLLLDGSFHDIEVTEDQSLSSSAVQSARSGTMNGHQKLCCWDYHPDLLLFAIVSGAGNIQSTSNGSTDCSVSLWRKRLNSPVESVVCTNFEGSFFIEKEYQGPLASPKVLLSPRGNFVAALDMKGCLFVFEFDETKCSLSKVSIGDRFNLKETIEMPSNGKEVLQDIVDFTWWSDRILSIAQRNGTVTMVGILNHVNVLENDIAYSMPLLERAQYSPGLIFLLETTSSEERHMTSERQKCTSLIELVTAETPSRLDLSKLKWSLVSLIEKSSLDMYDKLISSQRYQAALDFANRHGLDKDAVLKSQWLSSVQGVYEINSILPSIRDQSFVVSECVDKVGPTEDAVRELLSAGLRLTDSYRFSESEANENEDIWNFRLARLKLLQFRDRLETFIGINMGRFSVQEFTRFRDSPISNGALALAESGKIGALNLLFKRHPCSLTPSMLDILAAVPETIPVQSYSQLLPATSAPSNTVVRGGDWVECEQMRRYLENFYGNHETSVHCMTEAMLAKCMAYEWPSINELSSWYKKRARDIDTLSGQLDNCMCLVDSAICKGLSDLRQFREDIFYLHQLIYGEDDINFSMGLAGWEQLPDYDKFKLMLMNVKEDNVIPRLQKKAIPFMQQRHALTSSSNKVTVDSFLVRWLKEIASQNKLDMCLVIFEEESNDLSNNQFFKDEMEVVDCALQCIYLCTDMDRWNTMFTILSKLPEMRDCEVEGIKQRRKVAEGHVEAGRLLANYQVPKSISFFQDAGLDEKGVKQILRLLLSKFIRSHPSRADHDWANMWRDLQSLQEKAFPFLDLEYMLIEFCRGLLKAGKFSLARNYLKGTSYVALATDKAENLVVQTAREYFFSAPSLSCPEIWKAKECLNIFPSSRNVRTEIDIIDAVTDRLPNLGVNLLPMAFRQIKDSMEIIKLAITSQSGAYLNVDELIEIAKLLGLSSQEDISIVQEIIAREAAFAGDMQLAFDLCLVLAKKGHGSVWDLCAALARSQALESMNLKSQKLLLGFALSHCDEESISELLNEWKDLDMQDHCETLTTLTGRHPSEFPRSPSNRRDFLEGADLSFEDQEAHASKVKSFLCLVAENLSSENGYDWESLLTENIKVSSFATSHLPWLLELSEEKEFGKKLSPSSVSTNQYVTISARAVMTILSWLARNNFAPRDDLIASLAKSIMEPPVSDEDDIIGCSVLLNFIDAFHGVEMIEEQLRRRGNYHEFSSITNVGMMYGMLHSFGNECEDAAQRRELLLSKFQEKHDSLNSGELNSAHEAQSTFWNEWKAKLEQQKYVADESRVLEKLIPGVETSRFLSGDMEYIQSVVFSLIDSVKVERKQILKDTLILAQSYGLDRSKVLLYYLSTILVSEVWSVDDITKEISNFKEEILACSGEAIEAIYSSVYPAIDGHDKSRLSFIYNLLYECYSQLAELKESPPAIILDSVQTSSLGLARFCDTVGKECGRVSFITGLDFKNIAGLNDVNLDCFSGEVCAQIDQNSVDALALMVQNLALVYDNTVPKEFLSSKDVYKHYVSSSLSTLEDNARRETDFQSSEELYIFMNEIEQTYDNCRKYISSMEHPGNLEMLKRFFSVVSLINKSLRNITFDLTSNKGLVKLLNFWLRMISEMHEVVPQDVERFCSKCLTTCLTVFLRLLMQGTISPDLCWITLVSYIGYGFECNSPLVETFNFCRAMIFSGCGFEAIETLLSEVLAELPPGQELVLTTNEYSVNIQDLQNLYLNILETILQEMASGSVERESLHYLLSSLSKQEGEYLEELKKVRYTVFDRMSKFSQNPQLPSNLRVYVLELMQFISGRRSELFTSSKILLPWEGWVNLQEGTEIQENYTYDEPNKFTTTLVALKSTQLVSSISPNLEITTEDIVSVESAVSCFIKISESASRESQINALLALIAEWEGLFTSEGVGKPEELSPPPNNWNNDDWDEGWDNFQEESSEKELSNKVDTISLIHPLHICWLTILKKLVSLSSHSEILKFLDQNSSNVTLLDENDTFDLTETVKEVDCFLAFKVSLLLPYKTIQIQCLDSVESKLKEVGILEEIRNDDIFLVLVLSSGVISTVVTQDSYGSTFSYLCFMIGQFCREVQGNVGSTSEGKIDFVLFMKLLFPCFIVELVKADQHILAGILVTRFMHTNASLSLINVSEASLRSYLGRQELESSWVNDMNLSGQLSVTITSLCDKLGNSIQTALGLLRSDVIN